MKDRTCSVNICGKRKSNSTNNFFYFPSLKFSDRHNAWIRACANDKSWKPSVSNSVICSDHFHSSDYLPCATKKLLKKNAVPHLNLDQSTKIYHDGQLPTKNITRGVASPELGILVSPIQTRAEDYAPHIDTPGFKKLSTSLLIGQASKHWLSKIDTIKPCSFCNKETNWQCDAPICKKTMCLSPCFSKHQEDDQLKGIFSY